MKKYTETLNRYELLNRSAHSNGIVFFGEDWLYNMPIAELCTDRKIQADVYNRSLAGLFLKDADKVMDTCVCALNPRKVFINFGENDISRPDFNSEEFIDKYEWLLYSIHSKCSCSIYILSIVGDGAEDVNQRLKRLAEKYECEFIDIQSCNSNAFMNFFAKINLFLRNHPITFAEAMGI